MEYIIILGKIIAVIILGIVLLSLGIYYANKFVCYFAHLKLYGYYTNGIYVWQLLQYDDMQVTLYDDENERMITMGRNQFIRDFKFVMANTIKFIENTEKEHKDGN